MVRGTICTALNKKTPWTKGRAKWCQQLSTAQTLQHETLSTEHKLILGYSSHIWSKITCSLQTVIIIKLNIRKWAAWRVTPVYKNKGMNIGNQGTYGHNERSENNPAGLPPHTGPVSNHFLNVVVEFVCTWEKRESFQIDQNKYF